MITSNNAWIQYNDLANEIRNSIATIAKTILKLDEFDTKFYFEQNCCENIPCASEAGSVIVGISSDKGYIMIVVKDIESNEEEIEMFYEGFQLIDFIHILNQLEK